MGFGSFIFIFSYFLFISEPSLIVTSLCCHAFGSIVLMSKIELCSGCSWIKHLGVREALFMQNLTLFTMVVREERRGRLRCRCDVSLTWRVRFLDQQCGAERRETSGVYLFLLFLLESS